MNALAAEPVRVLYVHGGRLCRGGTEAYLMNYYRHLDRRVLQLDFAVHGFERGVYEDEIEAMGGRVYPVPVKSRDWLGNRRALRALFESGRYRIVHSHMDAMNAVVLRQAMECGIPVRISHSHNTRHQTQNRLKLILNDYEKKRLPRYATDLCACSEPAGTWLYGNAAFTVLRNAIDTGRYRYDPTAREKMRAALGAEGRFVVGHVGRFHFQKNHDFLLEIFRCLRRSHPEAMLMLVGDGERRPELEEKIKKYGLEKDVLLTGNRPDVPALLLAMDVFLFPSLFEGLGIALLEAECTGLPCVASDAVPEEASITNTVHYLALEQPPSVWAEAVWRAGELPRADRSEEVRAAGYDIGGQAEKLQRFYLERLREVRE